MSKNYVRKRQAPPRSNAPRQVVTVLASFLCGYLTATIFDFTSLSAWVNKNVLNQNKQQPQAQVAAKKPPETQKPKFEFYTLLSKDNSAPVPINRATPNSAVALPQAGNSVAKVAAPGISTQQAAQQAAKTVSVSESKPLAAINTPASHKESYMIQVASFNKRQDAEHLKVSLVLRGFDVIISPVTQRNMTWYRVTAGPFSSRPDAEKAQISIAKNERMKGIIRKMEG